MAKSRTPRKPKSPPPRVNYVIACSSHRADRVDEAGIRGCDVLRLHLEELAKTDTSRLAQVTIVRALPLTRNDQSDLYWDIVDTFASIACPVEFLDVPDAYYSYSSWTHAAKHYGNAFDYYIMIEDDYYPAISDFADELVRLHRKKLPKGGYLNQLTTDHAAMSNGIADAATFLAGIAAAGPDLFAGISGGAQRLFGKAFFDNRLADFANEYRQLFWIGWQVENTHDAAINLTRDLLRPIQYLRLGEAVVGKAVTPYLLGSKT